MSIGIGENLTASFGFAKDKLVVNFGTWLVLAILNILSIVNWIVLWNICQGSPWRGSETGKHRKVLC